MKILKPISRTAPVIYATAISIFAGLAIGIVLGFLSIMLLMGVR